MRAVSCLVGKCNIQGAAENRRSILSAQNRLLQSNYSAVTTTCLIYMQRNNGDMAFVMSSTKSFSLLEAEPGGPCVTPATGNPAILLAAAKVRRTENFVCRRF